MSLNLTFPVERLAKPNWPGELADLVRQTLTAHALQLCDAITGGAMKVSVSTDADAIQPDNECSGRVRLVIGGDPKMSETVSFFLNWDQGILEIESEGDEDEHSIMENISGAPALKKLRILSAEDSPVEQELLARILRRRGHEVSCVGDGKSALQAIVGQSYDVLITDNNMPHMKGLDLVRELGHIKIIVTSGYLEDEVEAQYRGLGVNLFLPKPSPDEEVLRAVEEG